MWENTNTNWENTTTNWDFIAGFIILFTAKLILLKRFDTKLELIKDA